MVDIKRSLLFDTYNGYLKTLNKLESVFVAKITNVGTVVVKAETYHYWQSGDAARKNIVFVRFTAMPHKARLEAYKLVMRDVDIRAILGVDLYQFMGNEKALISLYSRLFGLVRREVNSNFKFLCFPLEAINPTARYANLQIAKNEANSRLFEEDEAFITPKVCPVVVICKIVSKIHGKFVVITVLKDLQTNLLTLDFYFPQLMRKLTTFLFASNKSNRLKQKIVQNVEKLLMKKLDNWHSTFVDISKIHELNQSIQFNPRTFQRKQTQKVQEVNNYQTYIGRIFSLLEEENRGHSFSALNRTEILNLNNLSLNLDDPNISTRELNDISVISDANSQRFKNQLYWEILAKAIEVNARPRGKLILQIGNCRNILKETAFSKDVMIRNHMFRFEVVVERPNSHYLLKPFKPEMFQNLKGVYYYLKVSNFTARYERNAKLTFVKALELLNLRFDREYIVNIQVIQHVAYLISKQMFFGIREFLNLKDNQEQLNKGFKKPLTYFIDKKQEIPTTLHIRICEVIKAKEIDPYELLHKSVLMRSPLVTLEIHISHPKAEVLFLMYNIEFRSVCFDVKPVKDILNVIPFFRELLKLGDKVNLGRRLALAFNNMLIIKYLDAVRTHTLHDLSLAHGEASPIKSKTKLPNQAAPRLHFFEPESGDIVLEPGPSIDRIKKQIRSNKAKVVTISHV